MEAYGYTKSEWVCRLHKEERSATARHASGGEERVVSDYALPPKESLTCNCLEEFDLEALVREAYEIVKAQIKAEEGSTMEMGLRRSKDAEEKASLHTEDGAYTEAGRAYGGDMGEGAEQETLSSCEKGTTMEKVRDY